MEKKLTPKERWLSPCQGAMTGIFDDFIYIDNLSANEIVLKLTPGVRKIAGTKEKLFDYFFTEAMSNVPNKNAMLKTLEDVHNAQVESLEQRHINAVVQ